MASLVSAQLIPQRPKVDRLRTKVTLKSPSSPTRRWPIPKGLTVVLPLLILQTLLWSVGTVSGEGPYRRRDGDALLIKQSPHQLMVVTRGARAMVAVPTGVASARTVALVLAVLGYRRRLRRRDRWSRQRCWPIRIGHFAATETPIRSRASTKISTPGCFGAAVSTARADQADVDGEFRLSGHPSRSATGRCRGLPGHTAR